MTIQKSSKQLQNFRVKKAGWMFTSCRCNSG